MIKPIRPGKLRGLTERDIERALINLMGYDCTFDDGLLTIGPIDDYEQGLYVMNDARRLQPIGEVHVVGRKTGLFVEVSLNERALSIITNSDKKEEIPNDCKNTVSGPESADC